jgi:hypothetical protein
MPPIPPLTRRAPSSILICLRDSDLCLFCAQWVYLYTPWIDASMPVRQFDPKILLS